MASLEETDVEIRVGLDDTHRGLKMGVEGEEFWRVHITPQGNILIGDGTEEPTEYYVAAP